MCGALIICKKTESSRDDITELFPFLPHKRAKFGKRCVAERWLKNEKKSSKWSKALPRGRLLAATKPRVKNQLLKSKKLAVLMPYP